MAELHSTRRWTVVVRILHVPPPDIKSVARVSFTTEKMTSATQEEPSDIDTFYRLHTVNVYSNILSSPMYDRMRELEATGEHTTAEINSDGPRRKASRPHSWRDGPGGSSGSDVVALMKERILMIRGIVLSVEDKLYYLQQPIPLAPVPAQASQQVASEALAAHTTWVKGSKEIDRLMLMTMKPDIQQNLENLSAYDMLQELKTLFSQQVDYIDNLERLGYPVSLNLGVSLILISLRKEFNSFVQNYNMHSMGKMVNELHAILKLHEQTLTKKDPALHAIRESKVQKKNNKQKKPQVAAKGQNQGKGRMIQVIGRGTVLSLRGSRKLKPGALSLYIGNGQRATVEAIGTYHLCFPSGLVIVLNNCHYAPSITRGIISVSRLYDDGYVNRFVDNAISVSRNNLVYFSVVPRDGIFEIDLSNPNAIDNSMYAVSNKRAKLNLDSALLWHCCLGHISKKCIEKLQHDGLLNSTDLMAFEKCVSCISGKMARKPYTHQVESAKDHRLFETFKVFQKEVENQLGKTIKSLHYDHGGEYMSQEFLYHPKEHGIIAHHTPPYTPQHNGVSGKRNRTLLYMVCSMMKSKQLIPEVFGDLPLRLMASHSQLIPTSPQWTRTAPNGMCLYIDVEGNELGDPWCEPDNYRAAFLEPGDLYWTTVENILKYLRNTKDMFLVYGEAEYIAAYDAFKEAVWVRKFISGVGVVPTIEEPINMYCDNTGAITIANESEITKGARHFHAKVHYLREVIKYGDIKLEKVHIDDNLDDPFTKALAFPKHSEHTRNIGMLPASSLM
ncbi:zinc finger, CCHC-type containing protein [Tanacetum coccineum]|uniref:Zinc finger, CCHC-type containing protein n=1 Tax=Tanacetum coccineum TaxID=301880 RepID=A0ABQ5HSG4_9ASTR